jgi:misacylated tRNA(Ala) deacylase
MMAPEPGIEVEAVIEWERRHKLMRMHTALHLLCAAVEGDVTGGQVGEERGRLDFNVATAALDKDEIGRRINALIEAGHPTATVWITDEEMESRPELVRTMSVKPPTGSGRVRLLRIGPEDAPVDLQPCGGTHVANTAEIGRIEVAKIENKGKQNRRVTIRLAD